MQVTGNAYGTSNNGDMPSLIPKPQTNNKNSAVITFDDLHRIKENCFMIPTAE